jgi:hypothetical protein
MKALRFSEPRNGWMEITFTGDEADYTVVASAVPNDCVRDLVQATIRTLSSSSAEQAQFSLEPDYAPCRLRRDDQGIHVSIAEPGSESPVFEAVFPAVPFARRLIFECKRLQPFYGKAASWGWAYPVREIECLVAAARSAELAGAVDGSHPSRSRTNRASKAGSGR